MANSINRISAPPVHETPPPPSTRLTQLLDLLAYMFRQGTDVIGRIFCQIWARAQDDTHDADAQQLAQFELVRDQAKSECLDKFFLDVTVDEQDNSWGYAFFLDGELITEKSGIDQCDGDVLRAYQSVAAAWALESSPVPNDVALANVDNVAELIVPHRVSSENVQSMRREMAAHIKTLVQDVPWVMRYFSDVLEQKFASIPDEDPFWKDENPDQRRSNYDFRLKTEVFPGAGKADVFRYLNGEESYSAEQQSRLIDLCIAQDTVHVSLDLARHFLQSQGISASAVDFADNHFYIAGKDKTFIPNDGNCFFHCLDYLRQQTPSVGGDAVDGPAIDQLA